MVVTVWTSLRVCFVFFSADLKACLDRKHHHHQQEPHNSQLNTGKVGGNGSGFDHRAGSSQPCSCEAAAPKTPPWRAEMLSSCIGRISRFSTLSPALAAPPPALSIPNATGGKGGSLRDLQSSTGLKMSRMKKKTQLCVGIVPPFHVLSGLLRSGQDFPLNTGRDFPFKHFLKSKGEKNYLFCSFHCLLSFLGRVSFVIVVPVRHKCLKSLKSLKSTPLSQSHPSQASAFHPMGRTGL